MSPSDQINVVCIIDIKYIWINILEFVVMTKTYNIIFFCAFNFEKTNCNQFWFEFIK